MIATYNIMSGNNKVESGLFFDLVADGTGPRTRATTGAQNIRVQGWRLDSRRYSFGLRVELFARQPQECWDSPGVEDRIR